MAQENISQLVRTSIERRRQALVFGIAKKCFGLLRDSAFTSDPVVSELSNDWIKIESLSALRALVGGRFQNLKDRWVKAGFPLREHRGDRAAKKAIDYDGWIELSTWIHKQGYEIRLATDEQEWLFELKKLAE